MVTQKVKPFSGQPADWDSCLDRLGGSSAYQYTAFLSPHSRPIEIWTGGRPAAAAVVLEAPMLKFPRRVLTIHRGPAGDLNAVLTPLEEWACERGAWCLEIMPDVKFDGMFAFSMRDRGWEQSGPLRHTLRLDLHPDENLIYSGFEQRARYKIGRAYREKITVSPACTNEDIEAFVSLHAEMCAEKKLSGTSSEFLNRVSCGLIENPARGVVLLARLGDEVLGGNLLWRSGSRVEYLYGATRRKETGIAANVAVGYLLLWEGIRWAKSAGANEYDFGGYDPKAAGGPAQMKRAFCRNTIPLSPRWRKVLRPRLYGMAQWLMHRLKSH
jgi:peptidoglycan pentaglycine glycine transferase (the first glycine)